MATENREQELKVWNEQLKAAEQMVPLIGALWRERHVPTYVYGAPLYQRSPIDIIKAHLIVDIWSTCLLRPCLAPCDDELS